MEFNYNFERKSKHKIEKIKDLIEPECINKMKGGGAINSKVVNGERVKTTSKKLQNYFLHDCTCECCGRKGEFFALEKNKGANKYFLNLYTIIDGQEVLMLKELKVPTKLGGFDIPENWVLICDKCYLEKFRNEKQRSLDVNISNGYVLKYSLPIKDKYINISRNKFGQLLCTYVTDISKAKVYKNRGILKKRLNKMIELNLLPEKDLKKYVIRLKDEETSEG